MSGERTIESINDAFQAFAEAPGGRAAAIGDLEVDDLTPAEKFYYDHLKVSPVCPGTREPYVKIEQQHSLPSVECLTQGREIWQGDNPPDGKWKMNLQFTNENDVKRFQIAEALAKLKVANTHPESKVAEQLISQDASNINGQYKKMQVSVHGQKLDGSMHFGSNGQSIFWILASGGVQQIPNSKWENDRFPSLGEGKWLPTCDCAMVDGKFVTNGKHYAVAANMSMAIAQSGKIIWQLSSVVFQKQVQGGAGGGRIFRTPSTMDKMANATWILDDKPTAGKRHANTYCNVSHDQGSNPKYSGNVALSIIPEDDGTPLPLTVAQCWVSKENPDTEATLILASPEEPQMTQIKQMCDNLCAEVGKNLKAMGKTFKPNKKRPDLTWQTALEFKTPEAVQTDDNAQKHGVRTEKWFKLAYHFNHDAAKPNPPVRTYKINPKIDQDLVDLDILTNTDPDKLVSDGILKACSPGLHLGKGAKVLPVVCISKINLSPKFSFAFRLEYLIILEPGEVLNAAPTSIFMADGTVMTTAGADSFEEAMAAEEALAGDESPSKRRKLLNE